MKKIFLLFLVLIFSSLSAGAHQVVYDITGRPSYVSYYGGAYTRSINNYGSNALFLPSNMAAAGQRMRVRRFARTYAQTLADRNRMRVGYPTMVMQRRRPVQQISRFDKNYKIISSKGYVRNGIRYFD